VSLPQLLLEVPVFLQFLDPLDLGSFLLVFFLFRLALAVHLHLHAKGVLEYRLKAALELLLQLLTFRVVSHHAGVQQRVRVERVPYLKRFKRFELLLIPILGFYAYFLSCFVENVQVIVEEFGY